MQLLTAKGMVEWIVLAVFLLEQPVKSQVVGGNRVIVRFLVHDQAHSRIAIITKAFMKTLLRLPSLKDAVGKSSQNGSSRNDPCLTIGVQHWVMLSRAMRF